MADPTPPLSEQKRIVAKLDSLSQKTETLQQNHARQIADCAEMRQAILREAFEGRL
jgi:type I restriction enzyme S subunit